ncbi:DNA topoisomerase family protein [Musicola paradisiaca]|uniref:DNA topoisomerase type IA zn finger domain protein n=1 Tax=Musicola paradisiaca (strain Ech703) TaxID=579405 RepID=C6C8N3_MUSP7|nr:type I DNA topoisomerase [Musicola paradisiaca]ACS84254.1 DNA topoisomerase type IA zn finger domain protein [Musicola paradisiaca Ech703]
MIKTMSFAERQQDCPQCGAALVIRNGSHGAFLGCSAYPGCDYIRPLKAYADGHIVKVLDGQICPECGATLVLRQGRYGMFVGCGNYPECDHTEMIDRPDETTLTCPQCRKGRLLQRKSRYGKTFHSCERYPECQFTLNYRPVAGVCEYCHYPLLIEKKTAQGVKRCCASKLCGKPVMVSEKHQDE